MEGKIHNGSGKGRFTIATNWLSLKQNMNRLVGFKLPGHPADHLEGNIALVAVLVLL